MLWTYAVLITVKTKSLSNQHKTFSCLNVNPLMHVAPEWLETF